MTAKPWLSAYTRGVPEEIDPDTYPSLVALLEASFERFADRPAFENLGTTLTFADVERQSRAFAAYLQSLPGLKAGDRVAIMLPNTLQYVVALAGLLRAGFVAVNVNPMYTVPELEHQLADSGAKAIVVLENFAHTVAHALPNTALSAVIVSRLGDHCPAPKRWLVNFFVRYVRGLVRPYFIDGAVAYRTALAQGARLPYRRPQIGGRDLAFLQYTGGTTGLAKGAMLTQRNMVANTLQAAAWARPFFTPHAGVVVTPLPLYHVYSLTANLLCFIELGGHNLLITDPRDLHSLIGELRRKPFAFMTGVNTLYNALLHAKGFETLDFSALRVSMGGGMAVQRDVATRWQAVTGVPIAQGYGLTEASPIVCGNPLDRRDFDGSVGVPFPSTDVGIFDEHDVRLGTDEVGEICVRGPQVMAGYWQRPDETARVLFGDGWLRTGDVGRMNAAGYVFIEDRKKDVIVVSGFKVYPNEVEDVATQQAGVLEAAAIGVPDEQSGEAVKLFVVRKDPKLTEADVLAHARVNLTGYKRPKHVEFVNELPKSNVGKVLRRALKERADAQAPSPAPR
ncbi:MAG TPA: AMP-binding protein [Gammaproteobacteria bacterium]|jgi:long-chain acyl-CoA synthetase|nr:AMP-binding protein [Gammaproteobacteria bacterium]